MFNKIVVVEPVNLLQEAKERLRDYAKEVVFYDTLLELNGLKVGIIGMGATGHAISEALRFFKSRISYFSRTRKIELEQEKGYRWLTFADLLQKSDVVVSCLPKNTVILKDGQFARLGDGKMLFNISIAPSFEFPALEKWLASGKNEFFCDTPDALGHTAALLEHPHVHCANSSAGTTLQAKARLGHKVLENIYTFLHEENYSFLTFFWLIW